MADNYNKKSIDELEASGDLSDEFENAETAEVIRPDDAFSAGRGVGGGDSSPAASGVLADRDQIEPPALEPGDLLKDRYEILERIHAGGMGEIYRATDRRVQEPDRPEASVAVKLLRSGLAGRDDMRAALEREAARARRLSHPNVVNVFDFDEEDGRFFLVMEWLDGESLQELLRRTRDEHVDRTFAWRVIDGIARALQHAHANGIVHADVNPANVFITDNQDIKLLDFGVARDLDAGGADEPVWATARYASPERLEGLAAEIEDDVFSLGAIAYRLLAGELAFGDRTSKDARDRHLVPGPVPGLPEEDASLLERALAFERYKRPAYVDAFVRDESGPGAVDPIAERPQQDDPERPLWPWLAAGAAAAAIAVVWIAWPSSNGDQPTAVPTAPAAAGTSGNQPDATTAEATPEELDRPLAPSAAESTDEQFESADETPPALASGDAEALVSSDTGSPAPDQGEPNPIPAPSTGPSGVSAVDGNPPGDALPTPSQTADNASALPASGAESADATTLAASGSGETDTPGIETTAANSAATSADAGADPVDAEGAGATGAEAESTDSRSNPDAIASAVAADAGSGSDIATVQQSAEAIDATEGDTDPAPDSAVTTDSANGATEAVAAALTGAAAIKAGAGESAAAAAVSSDTTTMHTGANAVERPGAGAPTTAADSAGDAEVPVQSATKAGGGPDKIEYTPLAELDLKRYVAPRFPRIARYRDQSGYVDLRFSVLPDGSTGDIEIIDAIPEDVFVESAETAVSKWRFAQREDTVTAQVRLSFDLEE